MISNRLNLGRIRTEEAVHRLGYYRQRFGLHPDDFPAARDCADRTLAIPLHNAMKPEDYSRVAEALRAIR